MQDFFHKSVLNNHKKKKKNPFFKKLFLNTESFV